LWKKFEQFQPGTNFFAWGCQIARFEVRKHAAARGRDRSLFTDAFVDAVAPQAEAMAGEVSARRQALEHCLGKLPAEQRRMLGLRYEQGGSIESVAAAFDRSVEATYKALSRIR